MQAEFGTEYRCGPTTEPDFRIVVVPPSEGGHYHQLGRLRVLLGEDAALVTHASSIATVLPRECERLAIILAAEAMLGG